MISSRWPRPIGIIESIALRPVAIGSLHRAARNDAGRLDVDAGALVGDDRALAVDRIAERVDDAAEQALADRHFDDRAGALDRLAFLDLAVLAENDDADVVAFEVERHAARAVLELDHLAGLNLVEAVGAGDAVADGEDLADLRHFRFGAEIGDLGLENGGNFSGADVHQPTSFMRMRIALSLVLSEPSTMREPSLTTRPPMIAGSTLAVRRTSLPPEAARSVSFSAATLASLSGAALVTSACATPRSDVVEHAVVADHVADGEQAPLRGDELDEIGGDAGHAGALEDRGQRLDLFAGGKDRAAHQALQVFALGDQRVESGKGGGDLVGLALVAGEGEQRRGVAPRHSAYGVLLLSQFVALFTSKPPEPAPCGANRFRVSFLTDRSFPAARQTKPPPPLRRGLPNIADMAAQRAGWLIFRPMRKRAAAFAGAGLAAGSAVEPEPPPDARERWRRAGRAGPASAWLTRRARKARRIRKTTSSAPPYHLRSGARSLGQNR